jgi:MFS superfamily sulfate permease-like transporter
MEFLNEDSTSACSRIPAPGLVVCSFHGPLSYANAETFLCEVLSQINLLSINKGAPTAPRWLVVDFDLITEIDYCGAKMLSELQDRMEKQGVTLVFVIMAQEVAEFLCDFGFHATFRPEHVFGSVDAAIEAYQALNDRVQHLAPYPS